MRPPRSYTMCYTGRGAGAGAAAECRRHREQEHRLSAHLIASRNLISLFLEEGLDRSW